MIGAEWLVPIAAAVGATMVRRHVTRTIEGEYATRFPPDADGVAEGAGGFVLTGVNQRGLLLLHGSGDTPQSLRYLAERLHAAGYTVHAPLLPGHGRSPRDFARATAAEYYEAAQQALAALRLATPWVAVVGQSMGGALAARLAVESPDVRVLALLAPYFIPPPNVRRVAGWSWLWSVVAPYLRGQGGASVHDPVAQRLSRAYGSFSPGALHALLATAEAGHRALAALTLPTLVIHSETDNRIPRALALEALESLRAPSERHWLTGCGHVITVDYCKDTVAELVLDFLARHAG
jgi:carboxylesterase